MFIVASFSFFEAREYARFMFHLDVILPACYNVVYNGGFVPGGKVPSIGLGIAA